MKRLATALLLFAVAILVLRRLAGFFARAGSDPSAGNAAPRGRSTELVRDRICNTFVPKDRAIAVRGSDAIHYFCSDACRARFLAGSSRGSDAA